MLDHKCAFSYHFTTRSMRLPILIAILLFITFAEMQRCRYKHSQICMLIFILIRQISYRMYRTCFAFLLFFVVAVVVFAFRICFLHFAHRLFASSSNMGRKSFLSMDACCCCCCCFCFLSVLFSFFFVALYLWTKSCFIISVFRPNRVEPIHCFQMHSTKTG